MATAELAVAMPVLLLVLGVALGGLRVGVDELRCLDAARSAARLAARGEDHAHVVADARRAAPPGASVEVGLDGARVVVTVRCRPPAVLDALGVTAAPSATVSARRETAPGGVGG